MKKLRNKMMRKGYLAITSILITVFMSSCGNKKGTAHPEYKPLIEAVYASGNILPKDEYNVNSEVEGYLRKRLVNEGDSVYKGQPMFIIEMDQPGIRLQNTKVLYETALSNYSDNSAVLMELKNNLIIAQNKLHNDSVNFNRYKDLLAHNATSQSEYDKNSLAYKTSLNDYLAKKEGYIKTKTQLKSDLDNARAQYDLSQKDIANYTITSTLNGRVYDVFKKEGEMIKKDEAVAVVGDAGKVYLKLTVDETDIDKVKLGQEAVIKVDVFKDKIFNARISKIYPMLNAQDQSFRVDAEFTENAPKNFSGLTIEANIIINKREKTLTIPKAFMFGGDSVLVSRNGKTTAVSIKKGAETYESVEVLGGLDTSDIIMKKQ